jgi:hypothetical protein
MLLGPYTSLIFFVCLFDGNDFLLPVSQLYLSVLQDKNDLQRYSGNHKAKDAIFVGLEGARVPYED